MANYARVIDGIAIDVSTNPAEEFHPDIAGEFIKVPAAVERGWVLVKTKWTPAAAFEAKDDLLAEKPPQV